MSEVAEVTAEVVAENVEEAIDGVVETLEVVRSNPVVVAAAALLGITVGGVGGYFFAKKQLKAFYEDLASQEIAEARQFFAQVNKVGEDGEVLTPQDVMEQRHGSEAAAALRTYQGQDDTIAEAKDEQGGPWDDEMDEEQMRKLEARLLADAPDKVIKEARLHSVSLDAEPGPHGGEITVEERTVNVFSDPTFDFEEEVKYRTEDKPYIITHDEYFEAEKDYETISLTYFQLDDTLVDESDQPIENTDETVGDEHLTRFGSGSKDKNIVYVRNDKLGIDYEITRSKGSYLEEVLGLPEEPNSLKHSDQRDARRAFRHGDG